MFKLHYLTLSICLICLLSGCASSSLFNPYPRQAQDYIQAIKSNTIEAETQTLIGKRENADNLLYMQESGRLNQINNAFSASQQDFDFVIRRYEEFDNSANVSLSRLASQGSSLISNENAIPYQGAAYERIFAHQFQVFNYLAAKDIEAASVEVRRAAAEQRRLELDYSKDIAKAETDAQENGLDNQQWLNEPELAGMNGLANEVRSSFLNAYTYYTSAVIWEAQGDWNAASVDYKKALEIHPNNTHLIAAINRIAEADKNRFNKQESNSGKLVILFEEGFVPAKRSFNLHIPSFHYETYFNIAFPYYDSKNWPSPQTLTIKHAQETLGQTQVLVNVSSLAVKSLQEQSTALMVRQILRAKVKHEMQQKAQQQSELGGFLTTIYNIISEQADLRSWLTLPNTAQAFYHELPAQTLQLTLQSKLKQHTLDVDIIAGHTTLLRVIDGGNRLITQSFIL
ncbi:MAG: hypothetical protein HRU20_04760 [Pseudomonadales bacterium]|nr:hypothetical protein [Pseudomonadales bacterium]